MSWIDAGDPDHDVDLTVPTGIIDGTTIDSVRLVVSGGGAARELEVNITASTTSTVTIRHTTTADSFPKPGRYLWQVTFYDADGEYLARSQETAFSQLVGSNRVPNPTGDPPGGDFSSEFS